MKKDMMWKLCAAVIFSLSLAMTGCGGGGGDAAGVAAPNPDTDGDGIPNAADAFPNNAALFVDNVSVLLAGLSPAQGGFSAATAVNDGGAVVGFSEDTAAAATKAVRWTVSAVDGSASAPATLDPLAGGTYSAAYGINTAGTTVGESENGAGGNIVAAFWAANAASGAAATALPAGSFPGPSSAYGINNLATPQIVGEATTAAGALRAVLWNGTTGAPVDMGILDGGTFSTAYAINANGLVVGEADAAGVTHAVAWRVSSAGVKTLGPVDLGIITVADVGSAAYGVDDSGRVVGESENAAGEVHAGLWILNPTTLVPITPAASGKKDLGANATAYAIRDTGRIAGHMGATSLATVWDTSNTALPNDAVPEATLSQAFGLNDDNLVVGMSGTATGARALVAVPK